MSHSIGTRPLPSPPTIVMGGRLCHIWTTLVNNATVPVTGASPWSDAANCLLAFPFVLEVPTTFYKGFWCNGSAAGGNSEVGIWDEDYTKIVTTGSVAGTGNDVPQSAAFESSATPTLPPGRYYAGMAHSATTTNQVARWAVGTMSAQWQALGCWRQSGITLGSLAATATPDDITNVAFPLFGLITRSGFDV